MEWVKSLNDFEMALLAALLVIGLHVGIRLISRAIFKSWWEVKDEYIEEKRSK